MLINYYHIQYQCEFHNYLFMLWYLIWPYTKSNVVNGEN